jgi:hypothetical protein
VRRAAVAVVGIAEPIWLEAQERLIQLEDLSLVQGNILSTTMMVRLFVSLPVKAPCALGILPTLKSRVVSPDSVVEVVVGTVVVPHRLSKMS